MRTALSPSAAYLSDRRPLISRKDGVRPNAKGQATDKSEHILELGDIADPPHCFKERRNALWGIVIKVMLEGKFVKDWEHQNSQYRQRNPANKSLHLAMVSEEPVEHTEAAPVGTLA